MNKLSEETIGEAVVDWLSGMPWEVYQEVQPRADGPVADIVAVADPVVWIIECKASLTMALMQQALERQGWANYVSIAVPQIVGGDYRQRTFPYLILREKGIGCIETTPYGSPHEVIKPRLQRGAITRHVRACLTEQHKDYAKAGNARGDRLTPFSRTCDSLRDAAIKEPGLLFTEIVEKINHHYASQSAAKSALYGWIKIGKVKGVKFVKEKGRLKIYPKEEKEVK